MIQSLFVGNKVCVPWMELITKRSYFTLWTVSIEVNQAIFPKVISRWNNVISPTVSVPDGLQSVNEGVSQIIDHILMHTIAIFPKRKTKMCHRETKILCSFFFVLSKSTFVFNFFVSHWAVTKLSWLFLKGDC